ncbi:MAG: glycosyltransferase family 4 protein [Desulfarculaceae bacterium]|nr:glycosyltransferase family 4 protein [Desulfarculaceae bacterium]
MKRAALVTYLWPPASGAGVHRPLKFARYLRDFGWDPLVLTAQRPAALAHDPALANELPPDLEVVRLFNLEAGGGGGKASAGDASSWKRWLAGLVFPDRHVLWLATGLPKALAACRRARPEVVLATAPPFTSLVLGWLLARRLGLPLVLDFRDVWSGFYSRGFEPGQASPLRLNLIRRLEGRLVQGASAVITASASHSRELARFYGQPESKFTWLPNGYDPADFPPAPEPPRGDKFSLLFTGTLFGVTSLKHLWAGLELLSPEERANSRVQVVGRVAGGEIADPGLQGLEVEVSGHLPHAEVVRLQQEASALLLTLEDLPGSAGVIPSKLYEYLAARRPILALTARGEASAIVEACQAGAVVPPGDAAAVARVLRAWLDEPPAAPPAPPAIFSRVEQTRRLARILDRASQGGAP